jgi:5'-deoxynucleotidase
MKLIRRWSLMRSIVPENIQEHSLQVAVIAHALALIGNEFFEGRLDAGQVACLALYHDAGEVIIGDLPTPVKYFNPQIKQSYGEIETVAKDKLLSLLPAQLAQHYQGLFFPGEGKEKQLVKAADKISAYIKCLEEAAAGNGEFSQAQQALAAEVDTYRHLPEVAYFLDNFLASFQLTLDEMN